MVLFENLCLEKAGKALARNVSAQVKADSGCAHPYTRTGRERCIERGIAQLHFVLDLKRMLKGAKSSA